MHAHTGTIGLQAGEHVRVDRHTRSLKRRTTIRKRN